MNKRYSSAANGASSGKLIGLGFAPPETDAVIGMGDDSEQYLSVQAVGSPSLGSMNRRGSFSLSTHSAHSSTSSTRAPSFADTSNTSQPPSPRQHNRHVSLTSACLPATATYMPDRKSYDDLSTARSLSPTVRANGSDFKDKDAMEARRRPWRPFSWFAPNSADMPSPGSPLMSAEPVKMTRSKSTYSQQSQRGFLCLPHALVAPLLGPFSSVLLPQAPAKSPTTAAPPKKPRLASRLFQMCYVLFSLAYLTAHLLGYTPVRNHTAAQDAKRLVPRQSEAADQVIIGGWAQGLAKGLKAKMPARLGYGQDSETSPSTAIDAMEETAQETAAPVAAVPVNAVTQKWSTITPADGNALTSFTHPYRFSKMHSKVSGGLLDEIEPFAFRGEKIQNKGEVTACLYTNEAWLEMLPEFVKRWNGPISLVFESLHARNSSERVEVLARIADMRAADADIRSFVDVHFVSNPPANELAGNRSRERLITNPIASNFHLNLARFFARTEMVWLVGDARSLPSPGLRRKLTVPSVRKLVMSMGDALVIPTFAALRQREDSDEELPTLRTVRTSLGLSQPGSAEGVSADDFADLASGYTTALHASLQMPVDKWPKKKATLVGLASSHPPASVMGSGELPPPGPIFAMYDNAWDVNRGPSFWPLWRKGSVDPRLSEGPEVGGGAGLGINGGIGGGHVVYRVADYELHYSPSVVISKDAQPWCTERFDYNKAACVYQMYLSGAELWVLPDEWVFTLEVVDGAEAPKLSDALALKQTIASRLYIKYQSECCMHFGREFLSMNMWTHPRASHLRNICDKVSQAWGLDSNK